MKPDVDPRPTQPLSDAEAADVLRYWLGSMRYQEALAARPKALRPPAGSDPALDVVDLAQPTPGRKYIKLDWTGREAFVSARRGRVTLGIDAEVKGLCEDWLAAAYRFGEDDDEAQRVGYLLGFPTLLLPRGELGSVLRCPIEVSWRTQDGAEFTPPTPAERAASRFPAAPVTLELSHPGLADEEALPFFVDLKLLGDVLRVDAERIDGFLAELRRKRSARPRELLRALIRLLEEQHAEDAAGAAAPKPSATPAPASSSADLLAALHAALARRLAQLGSRTRAYPVALVVDGDQSRVTANAQRDIEAALERLDDKSMKRDAPLSRYLRGHAAEREPPPPNPCLGRFTRAGLTPHQLGALEHAFARRLAAIQGPPGTGKTTLILNAVADALVRKVQPLTLGHAMSDALLVVTSTNNAAVDNVTSALGNALGPERLPLALRAGSREVTEKVTSLDLERALSWLERHKEPAAGELETAIASFSAALRETQALAQTPPSAPAMRESAGYELFQCAQRVRENWAAKNRSNLLNVLNLALRAARTSRSLSSVLGNANKGGTWLRRLFPAFGSTLLSLGNVFPAEADAFERVIIDEAGQCHPGYAVSALLRASSGLIIGDVFQLEPVIGLSAEDERRMQRGLGLRISADRLEPYRTHDESGVSAQHLADRAVAERPTLVDHFRCQPEIAAICERLCAYGLVVRTPASSRGAAAAQLAAPVSFVAPGGEQQRHAGSWSNPAECREVVAWVQYLVACGISEDDIGVITPFRGQLELLGRELAAAGVKIADPLRGAEAQQNLELFGAPSRGLSIGTVHRFQGGERSVILLSTTITRATSLRFIDERVNLVNVAASRAREHLITVGHERTLLAGRHTRALLADALRLEPLSGA
jgi:hypothetical protein